MDKTAAKRKAAERAAKRAKGFVPKEVWTRPEHWEKIQRYMERLNRAARSAGESL